MARIDYCDTSKSSERTKEILGKNRNANIFKMMAHSPSYFEQYCRLGGAIRNKGELDPIVRELAITRTGILCEAPYEIVAHKRIGKGVGVTDQQNEALANWQAATCFNELQRAALAFACGARRRLPVCRREREPFGRPGPRCRCRASR